MGFTGGTSIPITAIGLIQTASSEDQAALKVFALGPRVFRTVISRGTDTYIYLINNGDGYVLQSGKKRFLAYHHAFAQRCVYPPIYSFLGELGSPDLQLDGPRIGTQNNRPTYILRASYQDPSDAEMAGLSQTEIEIDAQTLLPLRLRTKLRSNLNFEIASNVEYSYSDFRQAGPFILPYRIEMTVDGQAHSVIVIQSIEVDSSVSPLEFAVR